jgi:hypothetical protein
MRATSGDLFNGPTIHEVIEGRERQLVTTINDFTGSYILNVSVDDLCDHLFERYYFNVPSLKLDNIYISASGEADIDVRYDQQRHILDRSVPVYVKGTFVVFAVPFEGDPAIFRYNPNLIGGRIPQGLVTGGVLELRYESTEHNPTAIRAAFDKEIQLIQQRLGMISDLVKEFNSKIRRLAKERINQRREKLLKDYDMTTALGFPIKRRDDAPQTYSVPVTRKRLTLSPPAATPETFKPEPALEMQEYEQILNIISNMVTVMERSPRAFRGMDEEDLRQHFLVQLNGQYEGQATGETFNYEGKTDISIRSEGRNIFIAECKIWRGKAELIKALDQLIGYTSWRDTKTALIIFNRKKNLSAVLSVIPETVQSHPNFKRQLDYNNETGFRFILHQRDDRNREFYLTVLVFDVPS